MGPDDHIDEVAGVIVDSPQSISVRDPDGVIVGYVDRDKLISVLAGREAS